VKTRRERKVLLITDSQPWLKLPLWSQALDSGIPVHQLKQKMAQDHASTAHRPLPTLPILVGDHHLTHGMQLSSGAEGIVYKLPTSSVGMPEISGMTEIALKVPKKSFQARLETEAQLIYSVRDRSFFFSETRDLIV
jgi:hypothetical protein